MMAFRSGLSYCCFKGNFSYLPVHLLKDIPRISSAFQLYQMAEETKVAKKKSEYLIASYQIYDSAIKRNIHIPSYWHKNFALVCERMMHIESKYNKEEILKKVILHFELFLKKDPGDADNNAIRKALVSMKTQLNGFDGKIV